MTSSNARFFMVLAVGAVLAACAPEAKQSGTVESKAAPAQTAPPPSTSQPPAPATPPPRPAPAAAPPKAAPAPPPAAKSAAPPAPAAPAPAEAPKASADAPQALVVSVGRANMREKPDTKAKIIQVLTKGTKVVVVGKGDQWFRVRLTDGTEGWVAESVVTPASP